MFSHSFSAYYQRERSLRVGGDHQPMDMGDGRLSKSHSMSSRHSNRSPRGEHHQHRDGTYHSPSRLTVPERSVYAVKAGSPSRRVLGQMQPGDYVQSQGKKPYMDMVDIQEFTSVKDPRTKQSLQQTYNRLKERQRKLNALRFGLDLYDLDLSDAVSMQSELTDYGERRSMISATSHTHKVKTVF